MTVEEMQWKMAKFCYENAGDPDFAEMCRAFRIPIKEARKLALAFALVKRES